MNRGIGLAFSIGVLLAAAYAFAPRPAPTFPAHQTAVNSLLLLGAAQAGQRLVAVGERGHIVLSDDAGKSWRTVTSPTQATLTALYFHDAKTGWAVGHDSVILKTEDGGSTWRLVHNTPELNKPLLDVWFRDAHQGFALGAYGLFLTTLDGGASWLPRKIAEGDPHLNALAAQPDGSLFIAGEAGVLFRSVDHGQTWQALHSPYQGSFFGLLALRDGGLLAYGIRGKIYRSADAGETWAAIETSNEAALMGGFATPDGQVLLAGQRGTVLQSHDQGLSFRAYFHPARKFVATLRPGTKSSLWLFGESGVTAFTLCDSAQGAAHAP